jgi:PST family polysaccharide transporter
VQTAVAWYLAPVHASPRHASWSILRGLLAYGRFITAGNVLTLATRTLDNFFVARLLGATALGTYAVAFRLATLPAGVLVNAGRVLFPAYALLQDDLSAFRRTFVQTLQRVALLALPVTIGFAVAGEPVVDALLGSKWAAAVGPLRILALYAFVLSLAKPCGAVYQAAGKPHLVPLLSIPMLVAMVPGLIFLTNRFEANGTALAMLLAMLFSAVPSVVVAMRILELRAVELRRALAPTLLCSGILAAVLAVLLAPTEDFAPVVRLAILIAAGAVAYAVSALLLARETVSYLWVSLKGRPAT